MANRADKAWDAFFEYFIEFDASPSQIADRFNQGQARPVVTAANVSDWRRKHSRPQLSQLPELGHCWAEDPLFFARILGAVPADGLDTELYAQRRIVELRRELNWLEAQVRAADTTQATGHIVATATASGKWAVAVHPAIEGPTGIPMHVADRLDFRLIDGGDRTVDQQALREQLEVDLGGALSRNHVVYAPSTETIWSSELRNGSEPLRYSVVHTAAPFGPARSWDHVGLRSLGVVSITLGPWPMDLGALVARILGYGFANTRGLSQWRRPHGRMPTPKELMSYRIDAHRDLLSNPWHTYVWSHVGELAADDDSFFPHAPGRPGTKIVWLREGPDLIAGLAQGAAEKGQSYDEVFERLTEKQERLAALAETDPSIYQVLCPSAEVGAGRAPRWDRTFALAVEVVDHLLETGLILQSALARSVAQLDDQTRPDPINLATRSWLDRSGVAARWGLR